MMSLTFGLFTQVSGSGPLGPLVLIYSCREHRKILLRIRPFSFVNFLCVGIPILKIFLSHAHKWVSSDVILKNLFFSLVMSSPGGPDMVNG